MRAGNENRTILSDTTHFTAGTLATTSREGDSYIIYRYRRQGGPTDVKRTMFGEFREIRGFKDNREIPRCEIYKGRLPILRNDEFIKKIESIGIGTATPAARITGNKKNERNFRFSHLSRDTRIRTWDPLLPKQVR